MKLYFLLLLPILVFSQSHVDSIPHNLDTISQWDFKIDYSVKNTSDSIKPLAVLHFFRKEHLFLISSDHKQKSKWTPEINFSIYKMSDIEKCKFQSVKTKALSSCISTNIGGDIHLIGNYILLNEDPCVNCLNPKTEIDYCRPIIKYLLSNIIISNDSTFLDIENQIRLKLNFSN